jgi:NADH:ubiquinone oxidoreductase subunit F (NADH-binding)
MYGLLSAICDGHGGADSIDKLERLGRAMNAAAVCGLGNTASGSVMNAIRHFRGELEQHITEKKCPAGVCTM